MSADQTEAADICCASCGIAELDDIKLMECDACDLVHYCSDICQREHQPQHEAACKERAAELRDEILFRQPESTHLGDCPICFLPLQLDLEKSSMQSCCSKVVCKGCSYADYLRQLEERLGRVCPFCRHPTPTTQEEANKNKMKRVEKNDPVAIREIGKKHYHKGGYDTAFEYWTKAAELGNASAHYNLSHLYRKGEGVEKDEKKGWYHLEEAAIAGHPDARYNLACHETRNKRFDRAVKHFIIAANLGHDESIQQLKKCYKYGDVSKDDFAAALRAHQAAVDATKSPQREAAKDNA
eukprot:CAMPEP_0113416604 /NCGR_PEP_ID=MMETSP0013_2-20120614/25207_1 /TAXON_ID=2843 ORGANISM="Skeletonema costatum, Strain 1716" /NCGR_SAMPLE_ID=MMETSP0013_2 /ASSEMBLY_ACC=CAM_ASM_000158 /LENGTH=296 /DNA_ID=CAMNT_0000303675 /DNA_START=113 /DNA_END=1003 /DNA_ORIENTATION=- /assembly_acc=CAM_ASM_000158